MRPRRAAVAVPTEHDEQTLFFALVDLHTPRHPDLACVYAVPNFSGHHGSALARLRSGARAKREGRRAGYPDINVDVPRRDPATGLMVPGLRIELKRTTGGRVSPEQRVWHARLMAQGYRVVVARGHREAWAALCEYLGIENTLTGGTRAA